MGARISQHTSATASLKHVSCCSWKLPVLPCGLAFPTSLTNGVRHLVRGQVPGPRVEALRPSHLQTEFALGDFAAAEFSHYAAFEHYQNAVRQSEDFVQLGRDKQDAGAFVAGADDAGVNELNGAEKPAGDLRQPQVRPLAAEPAPTMVFPDPSLRSLLGPTSPCRGRTCTCKRIKIRRLQVGNGIA